MSNDSKLITIYISQNKTDILTKIPIIEALLNSAGIEYFSLNENVTNLYGGLNIVSRGIEIQVSEENVEKATELINSEPQLTNPLWRNYYLYYDSPAKPYYY